MVKAGTFPVPRKPAPKRVYKKLTPPTPAMKAGAELGARAVASELEEGEVMFGALVAVWSLMTVAQRKAKMVDATSKLRSALARMPHEQRQAGYSMLAHVLDALDKLVAPDVDDAHLKSDLGGI